MLPSIEIPNSPARKGNESRYGITARPQCLICMKPVNEQTASWVVLDEGLGRIIDPANANQENNGGCFPIGPECLRNNPQVKVYVMGG